MEKHKWPYNLLSMLIFLSSTLVWVGHLYILIQVLLFYSLILNLSFLILPVLFFFSTSDFFFSLFFLFSLKYFIPFSGSFLSLFFSLHFFLVFFCSISHILIEGSFMPERAVEVAETIVEHLTKIQASNVCYFFFFAFWFVSFLFEILFY